MDIELLYFTGCPNWQVAQEHLREALTVAGRPDLRISLRNVQTDEEAQALRFAGSPTIRINGRDPFSSRTPTYGLACRVYSTPDGLAGTPTVRQLVEALSSPEAADSGER